MSRMPCRSQSSRRPGHEAGLGHDVAALALHRLDDDGGHVVGGHDLVEEDLVEPGQVRGVAVRCVVDAVHEGSQTGVVLGLRGGQGDRAHGASVEAPEERDHGMTTAGHPRQLERGFDDLGAAVAEVHALAAPDGHGLGDGFAHLRVDRRVEVRGAVVDELVGLLLDGSDDGRV